MVTAENSSWRSEVVDQLYKAEMYQESRDFDSCGRFFGNFQVAVCEANPEHEARPIPFTCHQRFCPDCERCAQATKVARYVPILKRIAERENFLDDPHPTWTLKKIELTTPYSLVDTDAVEKYRHGWRCFERWQQLLYLYLLADELRPGERRRGRVDYTKHDVGSLAAAEFGESGHKLHFHILAFMPFIAKSKLTELWREATGGECEITWISRVGFDQVDDTVKEVVKYVTKFQALPPALVPQLVDVLAGSRRMRTYGIVRGQPKPDKEPCVCNTCRNAVVLMRVRAYFEHMFAIGKKPDSKVAAAAPQILLDLTPGIKAGDSTGIAQHLPRGDPDIAPTQGWLENFDALTRPFEYM